MIYRNEYTGKKSTDVQSQLYAPAAEGCNSMSAMPQNHYMYQPMMQNGMSMGTQGGMPGVSLPTTGPITASGAVPMPVSTPSVPSSVHGVMPTSGAVQTGAQVPSTVENTFFTPGFLRTQIGRRMRVEFLLGTNLLTDRTGTLVAVGASYIVLKLIDSDDLMMCDIYSIKFVTIIL